MSGTPEVTGQTSPLPLEKSEAETPDVAERQQALQEAREAAGEKKSGIRPLLNTATVVSIAAAIVSIASASYSYIHGREQDRHNRRIELTNIVEKLASLQDNDAEYQQYVILAKVAPQIMNEVSDEVSGPEYSIISRALLSGGDTLRALEYSQKAVDKAETENIYDFTWALRQLGWTQMQSGAFEDGKTSYLKALEVFHQRNVDEGHALVKTDKAFTFADWGQIAAIVGRCNEARDARTALAALLPAVIFPGDQTSLLEKLDKLDRVLAVCHPGAATPVPLDAKAPSAISR